MLTEAEDASHEIARFDNDMGGEIAPFGAVLLRSESAASSQIENLTASARAIAEAEIGDTSRRNAGQIVANTRAMEAAIALADWLDGESILTMHHSGNNVHRYINPLVDAGILTEFTIQCRNRAWRASEILAALDAFAARAGQRRLPQS